MTATPPILDDPVYSRVTKTGFAPISESAFLEKIRGNVLVYIHGYNTEPGEAVRNAKTLTNLAERSAITLTVIPVLWGSRGNMDAYLIDKEPSKLSGAAIGKFLLEVFRRATGLDVLAHSMGARALKHAMLALDYSGGPFIRNTYMVASDIPARDMVQKGEGEPISRFSERVHVLHAEDDHALRAGRFANLFQNGIVPRLGQYGAQPDQFKNLMNLDCGALNNLYDFLLGHTYFLNTSDGQITKTFAYILRTIRGDQNPSIDSEIDYRL